MTADQAEILVRIGAALLLGGLIGLERELRGRPAGLRTHMLVCLASALPMAVVVFPAIWLGPAADELARVDPVRLAQGLMIGVGFLGGGEIFRQGWNVRGLTTGASLWVTAAVGIVIGLGMYLEAAVATAAALVVLVVLDWFEARLPAKRHIRHTLRFARADAIDEDALRSLLGRHHFAVRELSRGVVDAGRAFEYRMTLLTRERDAEDRLCRTLRTMPEVLEFDISPAGD